jgi:hypothetical protein
MEDAKGAMDTLAPYKFFSIDIFQQIEISSKK